ncbi:hypothetical protein DH2020_008271 [Rehmannia glutinosa]|uniref:MPN domain-containing protein n=1 Tax=Rehmannia glutinosa TaxID=99300 RepID=A0ABR0U0K2_REHGL
MAGMERLHRMFAGAGGALGHPPPDSPTLDSSEQVYISSLALLKMLKHGKSGFVFRAGVPMEVMGLMLGEFVDEYTVRVVDVFAMPQSGTGVSVEAVDHVFQTNMLDMLKQTGRPEMVVGWYHSHPGFGCWLSGVDINTQQSFEALNQRAVAVVVDPIQSVKGKVALIHGLNRHYYSIAINYRKNELEEKMLLNLHKKKWTDGLTLQRFDAHSKTNEQTVQEMLNLAVKYNKAVQEEDELSPEKLAIANVGRQDAKKHLEEHVSNLMSSNIVQTLGTMLDTVVVGSGSSTKSRWSLANRARASTKILAKTSMSDEDWEDLDLRAKPIRLCLAKNVLANVHGISNAKELWEKLEALYQAKGISNRLYLKERATHCG